MATQNTPFPTSDSPAGGGSTASSGSTSYGSTGSSGSSGSSGYGGSGSGSLGGSTAATGASAGSDYGSTTRSGAAATDPVLGRVVQGAHEAVDRIAEKAAPAVEKLRSTMSGATDTMRGSADQLSHMQEEWVATARTTVREHPLAAIAVAVAAGMVLTKLMSSSR